MNPGSQFEPPTNPYRGPFEQPTMPPAQLPPPRRRGWIVALVAAVVVLVLGAGAVAALVLTGRATLPGVRPTAAKPTGVPSGSGSGKPAAPSALDVCAMVPPKEAERLVPGATVSGDSRDAPDSYTISFTCNWANRRISYNEFWRSREIDIRVEQHKGEGAKTGRSMAQSSYELDLSGAKYRETAKPELRKGEKEYISPMREIPGVGEGAFVQYTWRRSGDLLWYSFGEAQARNGDMTVKVKFQASQQPKDAQMLTNEGTKSINEENALREASALVGHVVKGMAAWQAANPNVLAQPKPKVSTSPTARPTLSPTPVAVFPPVCQKVAQVALELVPEGETRARDAEAGQERQSECRWLNKKIPMEGAGYKLRSAMITIHEFTNRAGAEDQGAARGLYARKRGANQEMGFGGITWSKITDVKDLGDSAFSQYVTFKKGLLHNGSGTVVLRVGAKVVLVDYAGVDVPEGAAPNSAKARLLADREAREGALKLARAFAAAMKEQPTGS
ncbi:hypothetical protein [Nonomuraea endophytica]|uniref:DUF3558 domain-containing protein n=1 Tax=Nonomuraea endophytica TaxID=714136 RepID=A0A7W8ACA5_9ACTN|nr:hypothetical protein [Nonomuraea endophytica]MBB5082565.1 hypothetical protein [Nonomuraea endophytica]